MSEKNVRWEDEPGASSNSIDLLRSEFRSRLYAKAELIDREVAVPQATEEAILPPHVPTTNRVTAQHR
jgi:hypothetical protein